MSRNTSIPIFCILFLLCSCVKELSLDAGDESLVVVECVLNTSSVQTLSLCYSKGVSRERKPLDKADAYLTDLTTGEKSQAFTHTKEGEWSLLFQTKIGHDYRIDIDVPGYGALWATQTIPNIRVKANYYTPLFSSSYLYEYGSFPLIVYEISSFPKYTWVYAMDYNINTKEHELVQNICTDFPYVDNFNLTGAIYSPEVEIQETPEGDIYYVICGPLKGLSMHKRYLRIPYDETIDKNWMLLAGEMSGPYNYEIKKGILLTNDGIITDPKESGYIVFAAVSEEYDKYLRDAMRIQDLQDSSDMSSIYIRDNIYSNINGGLGIFGAINEQKLVWRNEKSFMSYEP